VYLFVAAEVAAPAARPSETAMKRFVVAAVLALSLLARAWAEVNIPVPDRVPNERPGYCLWCCLEMLGRAQGVKELAGLKESRKSDPGSYVLDGDVWYYWHPAFGSADRVRDQLDKLKVKYRVHEDGDRDVAFLKRALDAGHGVAVGLYLPKGQHAVILTELGEKRVKLVDPNDVSHNFEVNRDWFDWVWHGLAVEIAG
jgi:hypothetical protein